MRKDFTKQVLQDTSAEFPVIRGPMYLGSNPELVAAGSEAGKDVGRITSVKSVKEVVEDFAKIIV